jgi:hypothetical protein
MNDTTIVSDQQIADWKKQYGTIYRFTADDGKVGYFKKPDRKVMDAVASKATTNPVLSNEILAKSSFIGGDNELITNDANFFGLSQQLKGLLKVVEGELVEL